MRKFVSFLIVIVLCFALTGCGGKADQPSASPASESPSGDVSKTPTLPATPQGYLDDDVDHYSRKMYEIVYTCETFGFLQQALFSGMQACEKRFNVHMTNVNSEGSQDTYLTNLELIGTRGFDGAIVDCPPAIQVRAIELLEESNVPYIAFFQTLLNADNRTVSPNVTNDNYAAGKMPAQWLADHYKEYMGDIDTSKLGFLYIGVSTAPDLVARSVGPEDVFNEYFSDGQFFWVDAASGGTTNLMSEELGYNLSIATINAHPEIEYWLVTSCLEFYGPGASRALEEVGKTTKNALVCVMGHGAQVADWESMSDDTMSVNVACWIIHDFEMTYPAVVGLIALLDGRATKESLWQERTPPNYIYGNDYGVWEVSGNIVTRQTYKAYLAEIEAEIAGM